MIDPSAVGAPLGVAEGRWDPTDCLIYALAVGAGVEDLPFVTENSIGSPQQVFPAFACVAMAPERTRNLGPQLEDVVGSLDPGMLLHAAEGITLHRPLPPEAEFTAHGRVANLYDKGSAALVATETTVSDRASGDELFTLRRTLFVRGAGGFGGDRGPATPSLALSREPDHRILLHTRPEQGLLFRLCGDRTPRFSDPEFARREGFDKPILDGLCTFGFAGRALLDALCGSDPRRFVSMDGRFTSLAYPGDDLSVSIWASDGSAVFRVERAPGDIVVDHGSCVYLPG